MYKDGLRAEGQLGGPVAKFGDTMMEKIVLESRQGRTRSQEDGGNGAANKTEQS